MSICQNPLCKVEFLAKRGSTGKYCSLSCSAIVNNKAPGRTRMKPVGACRTCGAAVPTRRRYCESHYSSDSKIESWLNGTWSGGHKGGLSKVVRRYLLQEADYACEVCGFNTPHPADGSSILEIDHINGDGTDHRPENLRVLCPNDHALTTTYRGRNTGKGKRTSYYLRVTPGRVRKGKP